VSPLGCRESAFARLRKVAGSFITYPMNNSDLEGWLSSVVKMLRRFPREEAAIGALEILLMTEKLHSFMGWPEIFRVEREVRIGNGRCDMVLTHVDGSRTLLEAKADGNTHSIVAGIGQLFLYEAAYQLPGLAIRKAIAVPGYGSSDVVRACGLAGVEYIPLGAVEQRAEKYERILTSLRHHAQDQPANA
jgi:hypothetical protein